LNTRMVRQPLSGGRTPKRLPTLADAHGVAFPCRPFSHASRRSGGNRISRLRP